MKHTTWERRLRRAVEQITPAQPLSPACREAVAQHTGSTAPKPLRRWIPRLAAAAAALLIAGGLVLYRQVYAVGSRISLDVNPGIEIAVSRNERVLSVVPQTRDARQVVGTMDFRGNTLEITVNALIGSMVRCGYLTAENNTVLVSVQSSDAKAGAALQTRLAAEVVMLLDTASFRGAVLSQTVSPDAALVRQAEKYGITVGKAQMIREIMRQDSRYTFASLVPLTVRQLALIAGDTLPEGLTGDGAVSKRGLVNEAAVRKTVLRDAKVKHPQRYACTVAYDSGLVYEITFTAKSRHYAYTVDAVTGKIRRQHAARHPASGGGTTATTGTTSTAGYTGSTYLQNRYKAALAQALTHAGVKESEATVTTCIAGMKDSLTVYVIEFTAKGYTYAYTLDHKTLEVLSHSKKPLGGETATTTTTTATTATEPVSITTRTAHPYSECWRCLYCGKCVDPEDVGTLTVPAYYGSHIPEGREGDAILKALYPTVTDRSEAAEKYENSWGKRCADSDCSGWCLKVYERYGRKVYELFIQDGYDGENYTDHIYLLDYATLELLATDFKNLTDHSPISIPGVDWDYIVPSIREQYEAAQEAGRARARANDHGDCG